MTPADAQLADKWREMERSYGEAPIHRLLGLALRVEGAGRAIIDFDGRSDAANRHGIVAGSAISGMVDSAVVQACKTVLGSRDGVATLELKVNFVRPGRSGSPLTTHGRVEHLGSSTAVGMARVENGEGKLVALGTVTVSIKRSTDAPADS